MAVTPVVTPSPNVGTHGYVTIVDQQGYVIGTIAASDGAAFGSISGESQFLYTSGGPPLLDGSPSLFAFDRTRSYLGKGRGQATITATSVGDTALTFSVAPKNIMPGSALRLAGASSTEYVYVTDTYVPSASPTVIPLKSPVVYAGQIGAYWDTFSPYGPLGLPFNPTGIGLQGIALPGSVNNNLMTVASSAEGDAIPSNLLLEVVLGGLTSATTADRLRTPTIFKPFNAQGVTASSANTPTSIWTPATGKKFRLMGYWFSTTAAAGLVFHDLASVSGSGLLAIPSPIGVANGILQSPPIGNGVLSAANNNQLWIDATVATTLTGFVYGTEES